MVYILDYRQHRNKHIVVLNKEAELGYYQFKKSWFIKFQFLCIHVITTESADGRCFLLLVNNIIDDG